MVANAVNKYKLFNFSFLLLELIHEKTNKENKAKLLERENFYLKSMAPSYNILREAGSSLGYKHSEITKLKMKSNYSLERRIRIGNLNKGKNFSPETIERMRESAFNRKPMSEETRKKCIVNTRPVILYNLNGTVYGEYSTILDAAKSINCNEKTIRRALKTKKGLVKRQ